MLKKAMVTAGLLIPGVSELKEGDIKGAVREATIAFTPLAWSEMMAAGLGAFYDEAYRELYGDTPRDLKSLEQIVKENPVDIKRDIGEMMNPPGDSYWWWFSAPIFLGQTPTGTTSSRLFPRL